MDSSKKLHARHLESRGWTEDLRKYEKNWSLWSLPNFRYQVNITVRMAVPLFLNRVIFVPWGTAEVPVDFLSQFLIEFPVNKVSDHSWWRCSRQRISYRPSESSLARRVNDRCLLVPGSIAPYWLMTAREGILERCAPATGFSLDHCF